MILIVLTGLLVLTLAPFVFRRSNDRLPGTRLASGPHPLPPGAHLLLDRTARDAAGMPLAHQQIFDEALRMIREARSVLYVDMFLWNPWTGSLRTPPYRELCRELAEALAARKRATPDLAIVVLTDPINRHYGGDAPPFFAPMVDAGIPIVFTDVDRLPPSNPLVVQPARLYASPLFALPGLRGYADRPRFANPFEASGPAISLRQLGRLTRFQANHRKLLIADDSDGALHLLTTSFNPADGSALHANIGISASGPVAAAALAAELDVVRWSAERQGYVHEAADGDLARATEQLALAAAHIGDPITNAVGTATWLTEGAVHDAVDTMLRETERGDAVRVALFYLSDRHLVAALKEAALNGADLRLILDPNRDAFGRRKNGVPNRPVAAELLRHAKRYNLDLHVRWADTHGEQFHLKAVSITNRGTGKQALLAGSCNWTRRNLHDLNLEANLHVAGHAEMTQAFNQYFDALWDDQAGKEGATLPYAAYAETGCQLRLKTFFYRVQEASGLCTF